MLLGFALLFYGLGFAGALLPLLWGGRRVPWLAPTFAAIGALAHTASIVALGVEAGRCPLDTLPEVLSVLAWTSVLVYLAAWRRYRLEVLHIIILPLVLVVLSVSKVLPPDAIPVADPLRPSLRRFHLTTIILGVGALFITFAASLVYVLVDRALKAKRPARLFLSLPSLERCDAVGQLSLFWAFPLLTLGIVTGAIVQANMTGTFWSWGSRETVAVIAWAILGVVVTARLGWGWRGRRVAILTIVGFAFILLRMLGLGV